MSSPFPDRPSRLTANRKGRSAVAGQRRPWKCSAWVVDGNFGGNLTGRMAPMLAQPGSVEYYHIDAGSRVCEKGRR